MLPTPSPRSACVALSSMLCVALPCAAAAPTFELFQADGYLSTQAEAFCTGNRIIGGVIDENGAPSGAVMGTDGRVRAFTLPGAKVTRPHACYHGRMMGAAFYGLVQMKGFIATPDGNVVNLLPPGGANASAQGANATGTVVGYYAAGSKGYNSGFIYRDGTYTRYDLPGAAGTQIMGIAEDGTMFGSTISAGSGQSSGFVDRDGVVTVLHVPGSFDTLVTGMNPAGLIVGYFSLEFGGNHQGFYWQDGTYTAFAPQDALDTLVWSVDDAGRAVGYSYYANFGQSAFVAHIAP